MVTYSLAAGDSKMPLQSIATRMRFYSFPTQTPVAYNAAGIFQSMNFHAFSCICLLSEAYAGKCMKDEFYGASEREGGREGGGREEGRERVRERGREKNRRTE
jgi:hypothetical protein